MAEACGDDRWKLSTSKGRSKSGRSFSYTSDSNAAGSSSSAASLSRSYSASVSSSTRNSSITGCSSSISSQQPQQSNSRLSKKCVEAVKEHRTRFYIVRRCVSMLVCWRDH